jgi:hypothetical protein
MTGPEIEVVLRRDVEIIKEMVRRDHEGCVRLANALDGDPAKFIGALLARPIREMRMITIMARFALLVAMGEVLEDDAAERSIESRKEPTDG